MAQSAIQIYYSNYVQNKEAVLPCTNFNPPGKIISRTEVVKRQRESGVYKCLDCSVEFTELTNARIRCVDCVKKDRKDRNNKWIANLSQQSTEKSEEQKLKIKQAKKKYNQSEKGKLYIKKRNQSEYYKELQRKCGKQYRQTERGKQKKTRISEEMDGNSRK